MSKEKQLPVMKSIPSDLCFSGDRGYLSLGVRMVQELEVIDQDFPLRKQIEKWPLALFLSSPRY